MKPQRAGRKTLAYGARLICLIAFATAAPLAALIVAPLSGQTALLTSAALISIVALAAIGASTWPLRRLSAVLRACLETPLKTGDDPQGLVAMGETIAARMDELRESAAETHHVTGLATRAAFLRTVSRGIGDPLEPAVLGVIRFVDYEGMAAFDLPAADRALAAFAKRLAGSLGKGRLLGQVGADTFAIWFSEAREISELQSLSYVMSEDLTVGEARLSPEIALGAAVFPRDADEPAALLIRALAGLSEPGAAQPGKTATLSSGDARERFALGQDLRRALHKNQFSLLFQPVVDLKAGRVAGAEALLRWNHPTLGNVPASDFIPLLEQSSLVEEVGLWVLNTACREAKRWQDEGHDDLVVAVNLSTVQCRDPNLGSLVTRTLQRHGLTPDHLELELTETAAMEDCEATRKLLVELRGLGISVAIDDFGAGYSSLTYLKNLPFSKLKIDREFVTRVDERQDSQAICSALIALARGLEIKILAEGVERREELETLRGLGCGLIQGYYFAKPLSPADFLSTITDPDWLALMTSPVHRQRALVDRRVRA